MADLLNDLDVSPYNGIGPKTRIYSLAKGSGAHTQALLDEVIQALSAGITKGTSDAVTIVGVAGVVATDPIYIAVEGTGAVSVAGGHYATDITLTLTAEF